jgi:Amt family ammonium transporter
MISWIRNRTLAWILLGGFIGLSLASTSFVLAQDDTPAATATEDAPADAPAATEEATTEAAAPAATEEKTEEAPAEEAKVPPSLAEVTYALDTMMLMLSAVLVLFMQAGFALLETGLNSAKNAVNIMFKNFMDLCIGVCLFWLVGFGIMYPGDAPMAKIIPGVFEFGAVGVGTLDVDAFNKDPNSFVGGMHPQADFLFQVAFAATAATIVSGAVAGRMQLKGYLLYSALMTAIIYPISGYWKWGGGWLADLGFVDFAGSVVVHAVGGFAGLAGAMILGPRLGRFNGGKSMPIPGHSITFAALGTFILIIGWFGFNPGSQLAFAGISNTDAVITIAVNTTLAAAMGGIVALATSWALFGKPDLTMALNGCLAGLVSITANCHAVTGINSFIIGGIGGVLVVLAIIALEKLKIDDPVGAFPVHGVCGVWGGIATGIFGFEAGVKVGLLPQIIGSLAIPAWAFITMFAFFFLLKGVGLLRVSKEEELEGLDISEHGMYAYPAHQVQDGIPSSSASHMSSMPKTPVGT